MAARFKRARGGKIAVSFAEHEAELLQAMLTDLDALLASLDDSKAPTPDPLAAMVGIGTATAAPEDPALARLFPDGYTDDEAASADFRRYTQVGLRDIRQARIATALASLEAAAHGRQVLDADTAQAWLGALNDLRLVLGERLGVTEDLEEMLAAIPEEDPRRAALGVYDWLGWVQETLVRALMRA